MPARLAQDGGGISVEQVLARALQRRQAERRQVHVRLDGEKGTVGDRPGVVGRVRREGVRLNTETDVFAFNPAQRLALPEALQPPQGCYKGILGGGPAS